MPAAGGRQPERPPPAAANPAGPRIAVAVSGGPDSTALLHAVLRQSRCGGVQVHALHVHHGLQDQADAWQAHVADQCARWRRAGHALQLHVARLPGRPAPGDSVEAWARRERYAALAELARGCGCQHVLLAHHRRDQAETVLLQALRGAGAAGLAAMPRERHDSGIHWIRPWLEQPRRAIDAYLKRWRLAFIDDPMNRQPRFARSRLRESVWPALSDAFPDAEVALVQVARQAAQAAALADEWAALDLPLLINGDGGLDRAAWRALSPARRANALRHWLRGRGVDAVPDSLIERLLQELPAARAARWPAPGGELRLHADRLGFHAHATAAPPVRPPAVGRDLSAVGEHGLAPWPGRLQVRVAATGGVPADALRQAVLRGRLAGDRFQSHAGGPPRALKKQFQAADVPRWQREGPVIDTPAGVAWVAGLGTDARAQAWPGQPRVTLHWLP